MSSFDGSGYKGKIGDLPIRMILEYYFYRGNYGLAHGKYLYEKQGKTIDLKLNYACGQDNCSGYLDEFVDSSKTGFFIITSGETRGFYGDNMIGNWSNPDKTTTLPFTLEKVDEFKLEDFMKKDSGSNEVIKVNYEDRVKWQQKLGWDEECERFDFYDFTIGKGKYRKESNYGGVTVYPIDNEKSLVSVFCQLGPYWSSEKLFYYDQNSGEKIEQKFKVLEYDTKIQKETWQEQTDIHGSYPTFDPKTKTLSTVHRSGIPYCGDKEYFYEFYDKNFKLKTVKQRDCGTKNEVTQENINNFKTIYQK